jgi:methionyl aminopeptidase
MSIQIKTPEEIERMRKGGKILGMILEELERKTELGMSTYDIEEYSETLFKKYQVKAAFKGFQGYPANLCTSLNNEVVHSIPSKNKIVKEGDILGIDCGVIYEGMYTDSAVCFGIGKISQDIENFLKTVEKALFLGIKAAKPGNKIGDISNIIQITVQSKHYSPVRTLIGHGVGTKLHEEPEIPNYGQKGKGPSIKPGMTFAIEPIINMGNHKVKTLNDNWTVITSDNSLSCQKEHTILITQTGNEILTLRPHEKH